MDGVLLYYRIATQDIDVSDAVSQNGKMRNAEKEKLIISNHMKRVGAKGGASRSPKKMVAIRRNIRLAIQKRWKNKKPKC